MGQGATVGAGRAALPSCPFTHRKGAGERRHHSEGVGAFRHADARRGQASKGKGAPS